MAKKTFVPTVGDRVSYVTPNGTRAQGIFKGFKAGSDTVVRVWKCARKNADGESIGTAGFHYADASTLKKGRKIRPQKMFGRVVGQVNIITGYAVDTDTDSEV